MRCQIRLICSGASFITISYCAALSVFSADAAQKLGTRDSPTAAVEMAPIDIKLPPQFLGGMPIVIMSNNFETPTYTRRSPFQAPIGAAILSQGKPVTSSSAPSLGTLSMITDGEKGHATKFVAELPRGMQWVQIDLGQVADVYAIIVWHFHAGDRVYFDFVVLTSEDADCSKNVHTLYNNDDDNSLQLGLGKDKVYLESHEGRLISALVEDHGTSARYVRLYSNGNTTNEENHYIEVEVWGKLKKKT